MRRGYALKPLRGSPSRNPARRGVTLVNPIGTIETIGTRVREPRWRQVPARGRRIGSWYQRESAPLRELKRKLQRNKKAGRRINAANPSGRRVVSNRATRTTSRKGTVVSARSYRQSRPQSRRTAGQQGKVAGRAYRRGRPIGRRPIRRNQPPIGMALGRALERIGEPTPGTPKKKAPKWRVDVHPVFKTTGWTGRTQALRDRAFFTVEGKRKKGVKLAALRDVYGAKYFPKRTVAKKPAAKKPAKKKVAVKKKVVRKKAARKYARVYPVRMYSKKAGPPFRGSKWTKRAGKRSRWSLPRGKTMVQLRAKVARAKPAKKKVVRRKKAVGRKRLQLPARMYSKKAGPPFRDSKWTKRPGRRPRWSIPRGKKISQLRAANPSNRRANSYANPRGWQSKTVSGYWKVKPGGKRVAEARVRGRLKRQGKPGADYYWISSRSKTKIAKKPARKPRKKAVVRSKIRRPARMYSKKAGPPFSGSKWLKGGKGKRGRWTVPRGRKLSQLRAANPSNRRRAANYYRPRRRPARRAAAYYRPRRRLVSRRPAKRAAAYYRNPRGWQSKTVSGYWKVKPGGKRVAESRVRGRLKRQGKPGADYYWVSSRSKTKIAKKPARKSRKKAVAKRPVARKIKGLAARYYKKAAGPPHRGWVWRKKYTHRTGKVIRARWVAGRGAAKKTADVRRRNPGNPYNPYKYYKGKKGKKITRGAYSRRKPGRTRKTVHLPAKTYYQKKKWYPHRGPTDLATGKKGKWITLKRAFEIGMLNKREFGMVKRRHPSWIEEGATFEDYKSMFPERYPVTRPTALLALPGAREEGITWGPEMGLAANPEEAIAMLPTEKQYGYIARSAGLGFVGFAGAIAGGRLAASWPTLQNALGNWSSVVGSAAAGLAFWAASALLKNEKLDEMVPYVTTGAAMAALANTAVNLVAQRTIPADVASWIIPGAGAVAAAPTEAVAPTAPGAPPLIPAEQAFPGNGNKVNDLGQVDVYEAALDGVGGIEEELEKELSRMGGLGKTGDGIFDEDVFGEYLEVPALGAEVEEAAAGGLNEYLEVPLGAEVEEAAAGGLNEYLEVPLGAEVEEAAAGLNEYLEVPLGAEVEEAAAGLNEYLEVPLGAEVEEAAAGLGQNQVGLMPELRTSLQQRPLMPGFREAIQDMVRQRISAGLPLDNAFYQKLGRAAGKLATRKFQKRLQQLRGRPGRLPMAPRKPPVLRRSAPTYVKPVKDPRVTPGAAEQIPAQGEKEFGGILEGSSLEGIF